MTQQPPAEPPASSASSSPTTPSTTPPSAPAPPPPSGPTGSSMISSGAAKERDPVVVILLSIVTLGIYFLYWTYQVFRELKEKTGQGIGPVLGLVLAILLGIVNWFVLPSEIGNMYAAAGKDKPVSGVTGFWNLIPLIGWIIWIVKVQHALNRAWTGEAGV